MSLLLLVVCALLWVEHRAQRRLPLVGHRRGAERVREIVDPMKLKVPIFGDLINKSVIARWTRTLSTMFAAGVPLVEALDSVGGASGASLRDFHNYVVTSPRIDGDWSNVVGLSLPLLRLLLRDVGIVWTDLWREP